MYCFICWRNSLPFEIKEELTQAGVFTHDEKNGCSITALKLELFSLNYKGFTISLYGGGKIVIPEEYIVNFSIGGIERGI